MANPQDSKREPILTPEGKAAIKKVAGKVMGGLRSGLAGTYDYLWRAPENRRGATISVANPQADAEEEKEKKAKPADQPPPEEEARHKDPLTLAALLAKIYGIDENEKEFASIVPHMAALTVQDYDDTRAVVQSQGATDILVTKTEVHTGKEGLTAAEAHDLALLALSNPQMRAEGVKLDGNAADRQLLMRAAAALGLKVVNPPDDLTPEEKAAADKLWDDHAGTPPFTDDVRQALATIMESHGQPAEDRTPDKLEAFWNRMTRPAREQLAQLAEGMKPAPQKPGTDNKAEDAPQTEEQAAPAPAEEETPAAPVKPLAKSVSSILKDANVDEGTYREARALVVDRQKASQSILREAFHIGSGKAGAIQRALAADGVVARKEKTTASNRTHTQNTVVVKPGERTDIDLSATMNKAAQADIAVKSVIDVPNVDDPALTAEAAKKDADKPGQRVVRTPPRERGLDI